MLIVRFLTVILNIIPALILFAPRKIFLGSFKSIARHKGGLIIACNHRSFKDYIAALLLCPFRKMTVMVSAAMYDFSPVTRLFLEAMGVIRVDSFTGNMTSVNEAIDVVKKGGVLLIYPEGKIETSDEMLPFRMGVSLISIGADAPVLPIYHDGRFGVFKHEKMLIGDLIYPCEHILGDAKLTENAAVLTKVIEDKIESFHQAYNRVFLQKGEKRHKTAHAGFLYQSVKWTGIPVMGLLLRRKLVALSETASLYRFSQRGQLIIANHTWWLDAPVLYWLLWRRSPRCMAAKDNADDHAEQAFMLKVMSCILIDRNGYDFASMRECIDELRGEGALIIFPEGRIGYEETMDKFTPGPAMISLMSDTPVWPVYIAGSYTPFSRLIMAVGDEIKPQDVPGAGISSERVAAFTSLLEETEEKLRELAFDTMTQAEKKKLADTKAKRKKWMKEKYTKSND